MYGEYKWSNGRGRFQNKEKGFLLISPVDTHGEHCFCFSASASLCRCSPDICPGGRELLGLNLQKAPPITIFFPFLSSPTKRPFFVNRSKLLYILNWGGFVCVPVFEQITLFVVLNVFDHFTLEICLYPSRCDHQPSSKEV